MFRTLLKQLNTLALLCVLGSLSVNAATPYYSLGVTQSIFGGSVDVSGMNNGLTAADRITVQQGHFFRIGSDGQPGTRDDRRVRLYGVNLTYNANFPDTDRARQIARRLRSLGFNAVRLHHLDSPGTGGSTDDLRSVLRYGPFPTFNLKAVERLKGFLKILKEEGIYVNLNLYVAYRFKPELDNIPYATPGVALLGQASPVQVFYPKLIALQATYAQELIRLLGVGNDPMLAMVEIRNESSLASAWQAWDTREWTDAIRGDYADELTRQWNGWLVRTYGSVDKACVQWTGCATTGAQALVSPAEADDFRTGQRASVIGKAVDKLRTWSGWAASPEVITGKGQRFVDFARFIVDTDRHYFEEIKRAIRTVTHPLVPITGTQMAYGESLNYLSQGSMDYLDDHFYIDHYNYPRVPWAPYDWRIRDTRLTATELNNLTELSARRDLNRPFVISEYNQAYPNRQGAAITPLLAILGALQDWDGLFHFDYIDGDDWGVLPSGFRLSGDWAKLAVTGQSAQIFRTGLVSPISIRLPYLLDTQSILGKGALRQRRDRGEVPNPLSVTKMFQFKLGTIFENRKESPTVSTPSSAATVSYSEEDGRVVFTAPRLAGFLGKYAPNQRINAGSLTFEPLDPSRGFATVVVTSMDEQPIGKSSRILVSVPGHIMGSQPDVWPVRPKRLVPYENNSDWWTLEPEVADKSHPSGSLVARGVLWMERVPLKITLQTQATDLKVFPLSLSGQRLGQLPAASVVKLATAYELTLQMEPYPQSPWYEIVLTAAQ